MLKPLALTAVAATALSLAACDTSPKAPTERGMCYSVTQPNGEVKFNKLAENQPTIEACVARLEEMRRKFLNMGGSRRKITGAYQGKFIFIDGSGVAYADGLTSGRFYAFTRKNGQLELPNVANQPTPQ